MPSNVSLSLFENNDETLNLAITTNNPTAGTILDLTGKTVEVFLKTDPSVPDADSSTWKGSTATAEVTLTNPTAGLCTVAIPGTAVVAEKAWWRVDVIASAKRKTCAYGTVTVTDT